MLKDPETTTFRHTYYGLLVRLLWQEPAVDLVITLQQEIAARMQAATVIHPRIGEGWKVIQEFLASSPPETVAEEFTSLFLGPFGAQVHPYESYYLTGELFKGPLIAVRGFLNDLGLEKQAATFSEPEDVLAFELEVMRWLIAKQMAAPEADGDSRWMEWQARFLQEHLLIWAPTCARHMETASAARFYRGVAMILDGFLEVERRLFRHRGLDRVLSLAEARQRYGAGPTWRGPRFEVGGDQPEVAVWSQEGERR